MTTHKTPTTQNNLPNLSPAPIELVKRNSKSSTGLPFTPEKPLQPTTARLPVSTILHPLTLPVPGERNACYKSACLLTHQIDCDLDAGRYHYRNRAGLLLTTLDQIVTAILTDNLATGTES